VTIKTPKYVIKQADEKPSFVRQHWLMILLLGLAVLTFLLGRYSSLDVMQAFKGQKQTWEEVNQELSSENERLKKRISQLSTEVKVKQQALIELQNDFSQMSKDQAAMQADLDFYENLLSHDDGSKKLRVFEINATQQERWVNLKLVLAQKLEKAQLIKGRINMRLSGIADEQGKVIDLMEQFKLDDEYEFKYFQLKKYTISLPKGFIPTTLLVELDPSQRNGAKVSTTYQWSELLGNPVIDETTDPATKAEGNDT